MRRKGCVLGLAAVVLLGLAPVVRADFPVQLSLTPDVALRPDSESVQGLRLGVWSRSQDVSGLDLGIVQGTRGDFLGVGVAVVNLVDGDSAGLQWGVYGYSRVRGTFKGVLGGIVVRVQGDCYGLLSGWVALSDGSAKGWVDGLYAQVGGDFSGLQTGLITYCKGEAKGVALGGFNRNDQRSAGLTMGLVNYTVDAKGLQLGFVNVTDRLDGLQIGLWNQINRGAQFKVLPFVNWSF